MLHPVGRSFLSPACCRCPARLIVACMVQSSQPASSEGSEEGAESSSRDTAQALHSELRRWVDGKNEDAKQAQLIARVESLRGRHAVAIKYALCSPRPPDLGFAFK